jgi:hypothetical protein
METLFTDLKEVKAPPIIEEQITLPCNIEYPDLD